MYHRWHCVWTKLFWGRGFGITPYFILPCPSHCSRSWYSVDANGINKNKNKKRDIYSFLLLLLLLFAYNCCYHNAKFLTTWGLFRDTTLEPKSSLDVLECKKIWSQLPKLWQRRWKFWSWKQRRSCWKCQSCVQSNNTEDGSKPNALWKKRKLNVARKTMNTRIGGDGFGRRCICQMTRLWDWGPLHTRAKGHDHGIVRAFDYHPKAVPWVLGYPFCARTGSQTQCEVKMDLVIFY